MPKARPSCGGAPPPRDHTRTLLAEFGWPLTHTSGLVRLTGGHRLRATDVPVPGDFSSAAFLIVAATLVPGSDVVLKSVGVNLRRTGLLHVLRAMGADIDELDRRREGGEAVADLRVRQRRSRSIEVPGAAVPE